MEKKLILILNNLGGGGAERVALNLLRHLKRIENYDVTLFLIKNNGVYFDEIEKDIKVIYGSKYRFAISLPIILIKLFIACLGKKHLISGTECEPTYFTNIIGFLQFKKPINWVHVTLSEYFKNIPPMHKLFTKISYMLPSKIICVSNGVKEDHLSLFPKNKNISVIYNILDKDIIFQKVTSEEIINHKSYLCSVGRLSHQKGFDILIKAVNILVPKYPNIYIKIFGMGPLYEELNNLIVSLNLQNNIKLMGFEKNIYQKIKNSNALILPSRFEGLGMVLLEAMLLSVPVIATNCPFGPREIIGNSNYGILADKINDPKILADKIEEFILMNEREINLLKKSAYQRAEDFLPEKIISKWNNILSKKEVN